MGQFTNQIWKRKKEKKKASESGKSWVNQIYYFFGIDTFFLE